MASLVKFSNYFTCANPIGSLKCLQCASFNTHNLIDLWNHLKEGHTLPNLEERPHECATCNLQTHSILVFLRHKQSDRCPIRSESTLPEMTIRRQFREQHEENDPNQKSRLCEYCSFRTKTSKCLKRHILTKHTAPDKIKWFQCELCPHKTKLKSYLRIHMQCKHQNEKSLKCDRCPFQTKFKHTLRNHIVSKHTEPENVRWFECEHCSYRGKTRAGLNGHINNQHRSPTSLKCIYCPFETRYKGGLKYHVSSKHTIQWFQCEQCSYQAKTKISLKRHTDRKHSDKRDVKCELCPFETKYRNVLKDHVVAKHTEPKEIEWLECDQCSQRVKTRYKSKRNLRLHVRTKHADPDEEWFHCGHCPYKTPIKANLSKHEMRMHTGTKK